MEGNIDAILIDDDLLVHATWELSAIKNNKSIQIFHSPNEFFAQSNRVPYKTPIYIDSNLSKGLKGELVAKEIHNEGFENIYLTTGFNKHDFVPMYWIKGILDKAPPWE